MAEALGGATWEHGMLVKKLVRCNLQGLCCVLVEGVNVGEGENLNNAAEKKLFVNPVERRGAENEWRGGTKNPSVNAGQGRQAEILVG